MAVTVTAQWVVYTKTFPYTGASQTWTVPYTGRYKVELWGAQGGIKLGSGSPTVEDTVHGDGNFSSGAYVSGEINLQKNTGLYLYVGQAGNYDHTSIFNGGGLGGCTVPYYTIPSTTTESECLQYGNSGGGGTDIRTVSGVWNNANSLRSRIMVAAGGGGDGAYSYSGQNSQSGGLTGYKGNYYQGHGDNGNYGTGGTQTSGGLGGVNHMSYGTNEPGTFGVGGTSHSFSSGSNQSGTYLDNRQGCGSGGGGGGWYGGGSGGGTAAGGCGHGGGGGSSYISGHTGSVAVTSTSSSSPKSGCTTGTTTNSCSVSPYGYTFTNTLMIDGAGYKWTSTKGALQAMPKPAGGTYISGIGHSGNGYARITYLGT